MKNIRYWTWGLIVASTVLLGASAFAGNSGGVPVTCDQDQLGGPEACVCTSTDAPSDVVPGPY